MQKSNNFWRKNSNKSKLSKAVQKFNAKLTREIKKSPSIAPFLPDRLNVNYLKNTINNTKDLNNLIKSVERVFKKDAFTPIQTENLINTTKYEVNELKLKVNRINRERKKELERAAPSTEKGTMGSVKERNLQPKKFDLNKIDNWKKFKESIDKQSLASYSNEKIQKYKENYLKSIISVFGEDGNDLYELVLKISPKILYDAFYNNTLLQLDFIYDPLNADLILEIVTEQWQNVLDH